MVADDARERLSVGDVRPREDSHCAMASSKLKLPIRLAKFDILELCQSTGVVTPRMDQSQQ